MVPLDNGTLPTIFPASMGALIVGGSELVPGSAGVHVAGWNRGKSLQLIREYEPNYQTDGESGTNEVKRKSSRRRRLYLAKLIGLTPTQMQSAPQCNISSSSRLPQTHNAFVAVA